jgi:hypothetical protein
MKVTLYFIQHTSIYLHCHHHAFIYVKFSLKESRGDLHHRHLHLARQILLLHLRLIELKIGEIDMRRKKILPSTYS